MEYAGNPALFSILPHRPDIVNQDILYLSAFDKLLSYVVIKQSILQLYVLFYRSQLPGQKNQSLFQQ